MALQNLVTVNISLETAGISQASFGIPIFIGAHRYTTERVRAYTSLNEAAQDLPANSDEYKGLSQFFSQSPAPAMVKLGRREADVTITPNPPSTGMVYSVVVRDNQGNSVTASHTAEVSDDQEEVVDGLKSDIDGSPAISAVVTATKIGTGPSATLKLSPAAPGATFELGTISPSLTISYTQNESAAETMAAITAVDDEFYFVTSGDHTSSFILALAADIESRNKMYVVSSQEQGSLASLVTPASDTLGKLYELGYLRTVTMFSQVADTAFPECAVVGRCAPYQPGTITWANKRIAGVPEAADPTTGMRLTATQLNNLSARRANFIVNVGGQNIFREGYVVGGEWIDIPHFRDFLVARITEAYQAKLINSTKIPYTDSGINGMRSVLESTLNRYVSTETVPNGLQENRPFTTKFPRASEVSQADKAARILRASFVAYLAGAIHLVEINGTLTLETE